MRKAPCWYVSGPMNGRHEHAVPLDAAEITVPLTSDGRTPTTLPSEFEASPFLAVYRRVANLLVFVGVQPDDRTA